MNILQKFYIQKNKTQFSAKGVTTLFAVLCVILIGATFLSLSLGASDISIIKAFKALLNGNFSDVNYRILFYVRFPRVLAAIMCGCALSVSGVIIQAVLNNSMASSNIIGINSGAGLGVAIVLSLFPTMYFAIPVAAFTGALCACGLIYFLSCKSGVSKMTLTLTGIAISSILNAAISTVKTLFPSSTLNMTTFSVGGFNALDLSTLKYAAPVIFIGLAAAIVFARIIDVLSLGSTTAKSLGMNVNRMRLLLLMIAGMLSAAAVSFSGLISFVGLVVPHIVRIFTGNRHRLLIPYSMLCGALLVLVCDLISRILFRPYEIPVGILLSFIGGPFFIFLILKRERGDGND